MSGEQGDTAPSQRLLESLKPLCSRIRNDVKMPPWGADTDSGCGDQVPILWLTVKRDAASQGRYHQVERLDDFEIYALLAQVDWMLWTRVTVDIWPALTKKRGVPLYEMRPTTVGIEVKMQQYADLASVEPHSSSSGSQSFRDLRDLMVSMLPETGSDSVEVPVRISIQYEWNRLIKIVEYARTQQGERVVLDRRGRRPSDKKKWVAVDAATYAAGLGRYKGLRIQSVEMELWRLVLARPPVRTLLDALARGLQILDVGLMQWEVFHEEPKLYVKAMQALFAIDCLDSDRVRGVEKFTLDVTMRDAMVPSVFAAIHASESVHLVDIDFGVKAMPMRMRPLVLSWMTYALFRRASTPIQELTLRVGDLTQEDIDTIDTILDTSDPLAQLCDRQASCRGVSVSAKRFSLFDPIAAGRVLVRGEYESTHVLKRLAVLQRTKEWMTVLLPGWGLAWVHQSDVLEQIKSPARAIQPTYHHAPEMTLYGLSMHSADAVLELLKRVGRELTRLTIDGGGPWFDDPPLDDAWLCRLLQTCPKLESLELKRLEITSFHVFLDGYVSGTCRLKRLALIKTRVVEFKSSWADCMAALRDRDHPIARCLSELQCHYLDLDSLAEPETIVSMVSMLEHNRHLHVFDLKTAGALQQDRREKTRLVEPVCAFDDQRLDCQRSLADCNRQVAFLSVLSPRLSESEEGRTCTAMEALDAHIVSLIFDFAARDQRRYVSIRFD